MRSTFNCWRCGAARESLVGGCISCGRAMPRHRVDRWNRSRSWQLEVGGERFTDLNHNAMMWYVARAAIERGISPNEFSRHHVGFERSRWLPLDGEYDLESFRAEAQRRNHRRLQLKHDDDLFWFDGQTWALTTEWGEGTGEAAMSFGRAYPELELRIIGATDESQRAVNPRQAGITQSHASGRGVARRPPTVPSAELVEQAERLESERLQLERERKRLEEERHALEVAKHRLRLLSDDDGVRADTDLPYQDELPEWLLKIPEPARRVFHHIAEHGAVNEVEATRLLGAPRYFRQFSLEFETYRCPFRVRIEMSAGIKCYVRDEGETE